MYVIWLWLRNCGYMVGQEIDRLQMRNVRCENVVENMSRENVGENMSGKM